MTDSIHWRTGPREPLRGFVAAIGSEEVRAESGHDLLELVAREALVGHDDVALKVDALEHLGGHDALGGVGGGQLKGDRHPVRRAQQIEPEAPEVAAVALAPAVGGMAGQLATPGGLPGLPARHRGAVQQPEVVAGRMGC
jgi:hypothetical protein